VRVHVPENDPTMLAYLQHAGTHRLTLQRCRDCGLLQYPPGTACEHCTCLDFDWAPVSGKGTIYSYEIVTHPIHPAYRDRVPYPIVLVELDEQRAVPAPDYALRVIATLVDAEGRPEHEERVAIGARVEVAFADLGDGLALPLFRLSDEPPEHALWRYPG